MLDSGYGVYMDQQQRINLSLMRELKALDVEFALPTRAVHLSPLGPEGAAAGGNAEPLPAP